MDTNEFLTRYEAGEKDFQGADLHEVNLIGLDLTNFCFFDANLSCSDLRGSNLSYSNLSYSNLMGANLCDALLNNSFLAHSKLSDANLSYAYLIDADLSDAILHETNLQGACLSNADLSNADLYRASLISSYLDNVSLIEANLIKAYLTDANLSNAKLVSSNLAYASLREANLSYTDLSDSNLAGCDTTNAKFYNTKLNGTILELVTHSNISNQGIEAPHEWNNFYFRSKTEMKIAEALDKAGVLFYPNCKARLGNGSTRENRESDFLIFDNGRCGILEVDGEPWHPPSRTVHDHERDRLFKNYGIRTVEHYDAKRCWDDPNGVVKEFLKLLSSP